MLNRSSATVTPLDTPRLLSPSALQNAPVATSMPALSHALAAEAAEMSENVNAKELAVRFKLLQRIFRYSLLQQNKTKP